MPYKINVTHKTLFFLMVVLMTYKQIMKWQDASSKLKLPSWGIIGPRDWGILLC